MRFIPTKLHASLDHIVGAGLIAAPWIFRFSDLTTPTVLSIVLGIGLILYSLFTDYELGVWRTFPMAVHNLFDIAQAPCSRRRPGSSASRTRARTSGRRSSSSASRRSASA
jgi:SPW repeat